MHYHKDDIERLIYQQLGGTISESDNRFLTDVLLHDDEMRLFYESIQLKFTGKKAQGFIAKIDTDNAWKEVSARISFRKKNNILYRYLPYAALLILACSFAFYFYQKAENPVQKLVVKPEKINPEKIQLRLSSGKTLDLVRQNQSIKTEDAELNTSQNGLKYSSNSGKEETTFNTLIIPETFTYQITLSDGTQVWLNSASQLRFPFVFGRDKREVYVSGEAYFKVAKNANKPFIVHTPATDVLVKGTSFNINTYENGKVITSLVEGKVQTKSGGAEIDLSPGKEAVFTDGNFEQRAFDPGDILAWIDGQYIFHDRSLNDLAPVIKRWYNMDLVFSSAKTGTHKMSGVIEKGQPVSQFLNNLSAVSQLHSAVSGQKIYIR